MSIQLEIRTLKIPFKQSFRHASAERHYTQSVLVQAQSSQRRTGFGESCPREYVTGESLKSVKNFFKQYQNEISEKIRDLKSLKEWMNNHKTEIDKNPAAWCAIELAFLDLFAKENNQTIESLLSLPLLSGEFKYTAVLGDSSHSKFVKQFQQYKSMGFSEYKVKLSGNLDKDRVKLEVITNYRNTNNGSSKFRVRVDANNLWRDRGVAVDYLRKLKIQLSAIEEPLASRELRELVRLFQDLQTPVILDESFTRLSQLAMLEEIKSVDWIINVRVSKMGGLLRSLEIVERARKSEIPVIIGAQVGETSILTRVALTVANAAGPALMAQEGAFGTRLLERDICDPELMWHQGGILNADDYELGRKTGFGINVVRGKH